MCRDKDRFLITRWNKLHQQAKLAYPKATVEEVKAMVTCNWCKDKLGASKAEVLRYIMNSNFSYTKIGDELCFHMSYVARVFGEAKTIVYNLFTAYARGEIDIA